MENDFPDFRELMLPCTARRMLGRIADVTHSRRPRWLENSDIIDIADDADTSAVPPNELESFRAIDMALRAIDKDSPERQEQYIIMSAPPALPKTTSSARNATPAI